MHTFQLWSWLARAGRRLVRTLPFALVCAALGLGPAMTPAFAATVPTVRLQLLPQGQTLPALTRVAPSQSMARVRPVAPDLLAAPDLPAAPAQPRTLLPASTCTLAATTRSCDLYAMTGTWTLPDGTTVPFWGYSAAATAGTATLPGPSLIANQGETLVITLHNVNLPVATSLALPQIANAPDTVGVTAGKSKTYTYTNLQPGTFLYEAGLTADGPREVALGLMGGLVVRPSTCAPAATCAYGPASAFNDEALVILSEIDPALNTSATPLAFNMADFAPKYWLINGQGYPHTAPIAANPGDTVLLRYINAGLVHHSMTMLNKHQSIIATDGKASAHPQRITAETIPTGGTLDALVTIPPTAAPGAQYALFDAAMHMDNNGALVNPAVATAPIAFGGMLTFLTIGGAAVSPTAPTTTNVTVTPAVANGSAAVTLTATGTAKTGTVTAMELFVQNLGADGAGTALTGAFGGATANGQYVLTTAALAAMPSGMYTLYVHTKDSTGQWGAFASTVLNLDKTGPVTSSASLTPSHTNGAVPVQIQATADDTMTGNQPVIAAEYFIDPAGTPAGGSGTAIAIATPTQVVNLSATIPASVVAALAEGAHTVAVRGEDSLGNWGAFTNLTLTVDRTGPATMGVSTSPNPTNGQNGIQVGTGGSYYQRIDATISDPTAAGVNSNVKGAEYFVDAVGANGTGGSMLSSTGFFTSPTQSVYAVILLQNILSLPQGQHTMYVHGQDAAGNWGAFTTTALIVDKTGPNVTGLTLNPNPNNGANLITLNATATDPANTGTPANGPASKVVAAEWFIGADPGPGLGTPLTIAAPASSVPLQTTFNIANFAVGNYGVAVRSLDQAGNWGPVTTVTLNVNQRANGLFADGFESGNFAAWSATGGNTAQLAVTAAAKQSGADGMQATIGAGTSGYVQDNTPTNEASYHARFYFNPNSVQVGTTPITIFSGLNGANATAFTVRLRKSNGAYQISAVVTRSNAANNTTNWVTIPNNAFTAIEIAWQSGTTANFSLSTAGTLRQTLTGLNTSATLLEAVRLGPQGALGTVTGTVYFDNFASTRNTVIGP